MKNFIVLSLTAMLFLATFFEVDSSSSSESSSESSPESSSETSSKSSTSSSENDSLHPTITLSQIGKHTKVTKIGTALFLNYTDRAESSSRGFQRGKKPKVTRKGTSLYADYTDRAVFSSPRFLKGKGPVVVRKLEKVKAEMKKLYKELAFGRKILQNNMKRIGFGITEALARKNVERIEQKIIALRPELREARGMENPESARQSKREIPKEIELLKATIKENDAKLKALEEKGDTGKRYSKLQEKQEGYRVILDDLSQANVHHGLNIYHYEYPELVDNDIVKLPFKLP